MDSRSHIFILSLIELLFVVSSLQGLAQTTHVSRRTYDARTDHGRSGMQDGHVNINLKKACIPAGSYPPYKVRVETFTRYFDDEKTVGKIKRHRIPIDSKAIEIQKSNKPQKTISLSNPNLAHNISMKSVLASANPFLPTTRSQEVELDKFSYRIQGRQIEESFKSHEARQSKFDEHTRIAGLEIQIVDGMGRVVSRALISLPTPRPTFANAIPHDASENSILYKIWKWHSIGSPISYTRPYPYKVEDGIHKSWKHKFGECKGAKSYMDFSVRLNNDEPSWMAEEREGSGGETFAGARN